jgi:hypothetical protein
MPRPMVHATCDTYVILNIGPVTPKLGQDLFFKWYVVATLALGLWLKQGSAKWWAKKEPREAHCMLPGVPKSVREWPLTLSSEFAC